MSSIVSIELPVPLLRRAALGLLIVCGLVSSRFSQAAQFQQVSFENDRVNFALSSGTVSGVLRRFGDPAALAAPLSVSLRLLGSGVVIQSVTVNFALRSSTASYRFTIPAATPGSNSVLVLEVVENAAAGVMASGAGRRVIWRNGVPAAIPSTPATRINAVVVSGASSPQTAVCYKAGAFTGNKPLLVGGIVALGSGGSSLPPGSMPVPFRPNDLYGRADWIPPLSPRVLILRGEPVQSFAP